MWSGIGSDHALTGHDLSSGARACQATVILYERTVFRGLQWTRTNGRGGVPTACVNSGRMRRRTSCAMRRRSCGATSGGDDSHRKLPRSIGCAWGYCPGDGLSSRVLHRVESWWRLDELDLPRASSKEVRVCFPEKKPTQRPKSVGRRKFSQGRHHEHLNSPGGDASHARQFDRPHAAVSRSAMRAERYSAEIEVEAIDVHLGPEPSARIDADVRPGRRWRIPRALELPNEGASGCHREALAAPGPELGRCRQGALRCWCHSRRPAHSRRATRSHEPVLPR